MKIVEITLSRGHDSGESTVGIISTKNKAFVSLEDTHRDIKVAGKTCIPKGRYEIKFREVLSGLTRKYQSQFDWFEYHLMLQNVPNFNYVYMHIGNYPKNTDGCILVARTLDTSREDMIQNSRQSFKEFYILISDHLKLGNKVFITIR